MNAVRIFAAVFLYAVLASQAIAESVPTIYVTTANDEGLTAKKRKELADSARDVREQLKKRDGVETADDEDEADVVVTILDRRIEVNETGRSDWGGALTQPHYQSRYIVFFRFESSDTVENSEIALAGAFVTWKRVAGVLAKDAEDWAHRYR